MKQLVVLSGKGGTGKTTVCSALIKLFNADAYADCDVDAPNLHLLFGKGEPNKTTEYFGQQKAFINKDKCIGCRRCYNKCKFSAIEYNGETCVINPLNCEGCGVCQYVCPMDAVEFKDYVAGNLMLYKDDKVFSTAELKMGGGTSGKLVTEVKKQLRENVDDAQLAIIDGSPGIGCPVIATLSGASAVLIVAEPSISGISDMKRIVETAKIFGIKVLVCVNKYDVNIEKTNEIIKYTENNGLTFVGTIPYDENAITAINEGVSLIDKKCKSAYYLKKIYKNIRQIV